MAVTVLKVPVIAASKCPPLVPGFIIVVVVLVLAPVVYGGIDARKTFGLSSGKRRRKGLREEAQRCSCGGRFSSAT